MARVVHHVEHDPCDLEILEQRAAVRTVAAALRGVGLGVAHHGERVGVRGDGPEALAVRCVLGRLVPEDRGFPTVDLEQVVRKAAREVVEVGEVDALHGR